MCFVSNLILPNIFASAAQIKRTNCRLRVVVQTPERWQNMHNNGVEIKHTKHRNMCQYVQAPPKKKSRIATVRHDVHHPATIYNGRVSIQRYATFASQQRSTVPEKMNSTAAIQPQSLGPAAQLFAALLQSLITVGANISPPEIWPADAGPNIKSKIFLIFR